MLTANQQQLCQVWPFLFDQPLTLVDWLPWNHTFGSNHNFNMVLRHAGTLVIDGGRPLPAMVGETVRNLTEISPTIYFNVPAGYTVLLPFLERDEAFAQSFFAKLRLIFYAGAALPQDLWDRLEAVAVRATGHRIPMSSSWGTTETAPLATAAHFLLDRAGNIGLPVPGVDMKLVPAGGKLEVRVRGPVITPGYWKRPDLTRDAFDDEGFYKPGDAVRFADPADAAKGILFDGRLAEDFKLTTGTWVQVGALRVGALAACSPVLQDAIVAGADREFVGLLCWLNAAGCQKLIGDGAPATLAELAQHPAVREHVRRSLMQWNAAHPGSSERIARAILLGDAPSIDANEITDKGYINQRLALERRATDVQRLFAAQPDPGRDRGLTLRDRAPLAGAVARLLRLSQHVERKPRLRHVDDIVRQRVHPIARIARGHQHGDARPQHFDAERQIDPVKQARQSNVREDQRDVVAMLAKRGERLLGILALDNTQVGLLQQRGRQLTHDRIVLDDQGHRAFRMCCHGTSP